MAHIMNSKYHGMDIHGGNHMQELYAKHVYMYCFQEQVAFAFIGKICICESKKHNKASCLYTWIKKKWTFFTTQGRKQKWHRTKSKIIGTKSN